LLRKGQWNGKQLVPADYIAKCNQPSPYNPHTPFSLQFEHNSDGHVPGAPKDAFYKSGAGGFGIFVVPSLASLMSVTSSMTWASSRFRSRFGKVGSAHVADE